MLDFKNADMLPPIQFELAVESALENEPSGRMQLFALDHDLEAFVLIGDVRVGMADTVVRVPLDPQQFVAPIGRVDVILKQIVLVPFIAFRFESRFDVLRVGLQMR